MKESKVTSDYVEGDVISLYPLESGIGAVVLDSLGANYQNQVGGLMMWQKVERRFYLPFYENEKLVEALYDYFFKGKKWGGECFNGIDSETADFLDVIFEKEVISHKLLVNRDRMHESVEAWVYAKAYDTNNDFKKGEWFDVVITWTNCD